VRRIRREYPLPPVPQQDLQRLQVYPLRNAYCCQCHWLPDWGDYLISSFAIQKKVSMWQSARYRELCGIYYPPFSIVITTCTFSCGEVLAISYFSAFNDCSASVAMSAFIKSTPSGVNY
jgi:hypothetical protein